MGGKFLENRFQASRTPFLSLRLPPKTKETKIQGREHFLKAGFCLKYKITGIAITRKVNSASYSLFPGVFGFFTERIGIAMEVFVLFLKHFLKPWAIGELLRLGDGA